MQKEELEAEKKRLIELLGVYFEQEKQNPPLASRILATLILHGNHGTTFEQLVSELEASKGTISTHLNSLIAQQRIGYFTKSGDRKRYYTISGNLIFRKIDDLLNQWKNEIGLRQQVIAYKTAYNQTHPDEPFSLIMEKEMLNFLQNSVAYFGEQASIYQTKDKQNNSKIL